MCMGHGAWSPLFEPDCYGTVLHWMGLLQLGTYLPKVMCLGRLLFSG